LLARQLARLLAAVVQQQQEKVRLLPVLVLVRQLASLRLAVVRQLAFLRLAVVRQLAQRLVQVEVSSHPRPLLKVYLP
jgi:hypothetical protein